MAAPRQRRQQLGGSSGPKRKKLSVVRITGLILAFTVGLVVFAGRTATVQLSETTTATTQSQPLLAVEAPRQHRSKTRDEAVLMPKKFSLSTTPNARPRQSFVSTGNATVIAWAVSLIKCGDFQSSTAGLSDAALVLRHSIHQNSIRNPASGSRYDYKMYAIVHTEAAECSHVLADAGFEIVMKDSPVAKKDIEGEFLRKHIHREWCCGEAEFIKLYAYMLSEPVVVHMDMDFAIHQPMDDIFNVMLSNDPVTVQAAKSRIPLERPTDSWPERTDAFMTRDWPQVMPGRKAGYQAGFLVVRPDKQVFDEIVAVIKKGDYVEGFQHENGWGGAGYGGFVGAMAMQGLLAYYYDILRPNMWMELNQCRYNHMGMDVLYRSQPSFRRKHPKVGKCRNNLDYCEDCMHTEMDEIYSIHYTQCRKPWNCVGVGSNSEGADKKSIPEDSVHFPHCMELLTIWHAHRQDLETKLLAISGDKSIEKGRGGDYKNEVFQGHCSSEGSYLELSSAAQPETWKLLPDLYAA